MQRRQIYIIHPVLCTRYNNLIRGSFNIKPLLGVAALHARLRTLIHYSPVLQVNCPILHDGGLIPPFVILETAPLIIPDESHVHMLFSNKQKVTSLHQNYSWSHTLMTYNIQ
jgi:hypothetical protein